MGNAAISGRDPSKIEKLGTLYARFIAKSLVSNGLCHRVEVSLSYIKDMSEPLNVSVNSFGTSIENLSDSQLNHIVKENFDLRISSMLRELNLKSPIWRRTSRFGLFGRSDPSFTWEKPKQ